ncbi:MAG: MFS transporter [Xanthobacteraceae bacterium]|nr:MAG: MFS transporter [Xanthobacteraceae bacterium]
MTSSDPVPFTPVPHRAGLYMAALQLVFTLGWTVYAIYLPRLAHDVGLPASAVLWILMLDQAIFTLSDFAMGVMADKVSRVVGRLGRIVAAVTLVSSLAFLLLPFVAREGTRATWLFLALVVIWAVTASALRAPPLMLLGKYAARPAVPWLAALAMLGYGLAGAAAPYLALMLRGLDARLPFVIASVAVVTATLGLSAIERMLAHHPAAAPSPAAQPLAFTGAARATLLFVVAMLAFGLGFQIHFALNSPPLFLRFAPPADLALLMPVFWVGFNLMMFPASVVTRRLGGFAVMGFAGVIGATALGAAQVAGGLGFLVAAQFVAGAAWGALLMSAFAAATALGASGAEGRTLGLMFSALALATFARIAAVAADMKSDPLLAAALPWLPAVAWIIAGLMLLALIAARGRAKAAAPSREAAA